MPYRFQQMLQETGLADGASGWRELLFEPSPAKAGGSGVMILLGALWQISSSVLFAGIFVAWGIWMLLGLIAARSAGEEFCANKALGGLWKLATAVLLLWLFTTVQAVAAEQGQDLWWLPLGGGGWLFGVFVWKAITKGNEILPGVQDWLGKVLPSAYQGDTPRMPGQEHENEEGK